MQFFAQVAYFLKGGGIESVYPFEKVVPGLKLLNERLPIFLDCPKVECSKIIEKYFFWR
jgi:hypothetical protein